MKPWCAREIGVCVNAPDCRVAVTEHEACRGPIGTPLFVALRTGKQRAFDVPILTRVPCEQIVYHTPEFRSRQREGVTMCCDESPIVDNTLANCMGTDKGHWHPLTTAMSRE